ncbi:YggS family pyridoxal phosphate-dependent enzyme [Garciella nitratireducens]|uniref:Pyridoxal phosphate homeostasis protein n=1 Tax=Garciella nitratireducens DSM 15102 TaxID=1121911 RepID=A0A1T4JZV6_9FIRM|nr:YggS family pyridoxal phosphate-dependent enzyme [Garciella nitratireducens]RBP39192.1 hypothetical protein DFR81_11617 [Garciella nitratireducens]SJZ35664.1 hypothetical protein SAMN02745973_00246 [Garciella nitratireducens DSM 15102]
MLEQKLIDENIKNIIQNIDKAAKKSGRSLEDITLIAVSKTVDVESMKYIYQKGFNNFGENRVQELTKKFTQFDDKVNWHFIGHLQRNKVKYIVDKVKLIHSVDSIRLLKEINLQAKKIGRQIPVLVQVNVAKEESKFGIKTNEIKDFMREAVNYSNIIIKGFMMIAPYEEDPEKVRPFFMELREIYDKIKKKERHNIKMQYLSMGMTNDYTVAIEEGSNMIRIGTGIFGKRMYS